MLPAPHRLHRSADFARALRAGRRCARSALVLHLAAPATAASSEQRDALPARAGFVVSRSVGGAVTRNAVTRRLRALVGERLSLLPPGSVLVVRALPPAAATPFGDLAAQIDGCLAGLLRTGGAVGEVSR